MLALTLLSDAIAGDAQLLAPSAARLQKRAGLFLPPAPVGFYLEPGGDALWIHAPGLDAGWRALAKAAAAEAEVVEPGRIGFLADAGPGRQSPLVKVAYSAGLRQALEYLNFFPGQYPLSIPNHATPLAALLTSAAVGAGLGWGGGKLLGALAPAGYGRRLGRTGMILGGLAGGAFGAIPGAANLMGGRSFNDPLPFGSDPDEPPDLRPEPAEPATGEALDEALPSPWKAAPTEAWRKRGHANEHYGSRYGPYSDPYRDIGNVADVHLPSLTKMLGAADVSPLYAHSVAAPFYAAQTHAMGGPAGHDPEWVTGDQLGRLAAKAGTGYLKGLLVGAAVNAAVGTPYQPSQFGLAGAAAAFVGAVVPKLFGA